MVDAFNTRICNTGEDTADTLAGIPELQSGSLAIGGLNVPSPAPPLGESMKMPVTPPVVASPGGSGTADCPYELGECKGWQDADELADINDWDKDDPPDFDPSIGCIDAVPVPPPAKHDGVIFRFMSRVVYKADGDQILYGYCREMIIDSVGAVCYISPEERVIIDEPAICEQCDSSSVGI